VTDRSDLEARLAELDRKLRELQSELAAVSRSADSSPREEPPASPDEVVEQAAARVAELGRRIDDLVRLRADLDEATEELKRQSPQRGQTSETRPADEYPSR
jgi:prefoldin subunit 5